MAQNEPEDFYGIEDLPAKIQNDRSEFKEKRRDYEYNSLQKSYSKPRHLDKDEKVPRFDRNGRKLSKFENSTKTQPRVDLVSEVYEERFGIGSRENMSRIAVDEKQYETKKKLNKITSEVENVRLKDQFTKIPEKPVKANQFISKIKEEKEEDNLKEIQKRDRDGSLTSLHRLWSLIPDVQSMTNDEILELLLSRVLFNEHEIIALDKPYGLPSVPGQGHKRALSSFLEPLKKILAPDADRLYLAHRLDRSTTGVIILTTSQQRFLDFKEMFREKTIIKKYLTITRSIPNPPEGIIKIPLGYREVANRFKMIPIPKRNEDNQEAVVKDRREQFDAVTEYRVLSTGHKCALVETTIPTGVTHQIRSHLGFGLGCPVLGDHKYSDFLKFEPQRLPTETLHRLGIRSAKSRHLPIYLHAKELILPEFADGGNLFVRADVPKFFLYTMKKLKLFFPK